MLQAYRVASGKPAATYQRPARAPRRAEVVRARSRRPARSASRAGGCTASRGRARPSRPAVLDRYPSLARRRDRARRSARSDAFTEFDGHVPAAGAVLDPCDPARVDFADAARRAPPSVRSGTSSGAASASTRSRAAIATATSGSTRCCADRCCTISTRELMRRCRAGKRRAKLPDDHDWLRQRGEEMLARPRRRDAAAVRGSARPRDAPAPRRPGALCRGRGQRSTRRARRSASKCRSAGQTPWTTSRWRRREPVDHRPRRRLEAADRRPHRSHRSGRAGDVRDRRLQDRRLLGRRLAGHVRRRHAAAARALRSGGARAAASAMHKKAARRRRASTTSPARRASRSASAFRRRRSATSARCSATCAT